MIILSNFVERLKEYISEYNLTEKSLADKLGCSYVTISSILNERHAPSTLLLIEMVKLFNCSADYLLGIVDYPDECKIPPTKPFSQQLRKLLRESEKSEKSFYIDFKISSNLSYRWLHKNTLPSVDSLYRLSKYFGCTIDFLLGRER